MRILTNVNIDWLRWRWHTLALSWLIILGGVGMMIVRGVPLGIDFAGGTNVTVRFEKAVSDDAVRTALASIPGEVQIQQFGDAANNQKLIKLPQGTTAEQGSALDQTAATVVSYLEKSNLGKIEVIQTEFVGPVIGQDLQRKGIYATIGSLLGIMAYIAFRFRLSFGIGAMTASIHDVLITLSIMTFAGYELSLNVIAAILTLVGYGVNDQIVIFDRVRENLRSHRREPMKDIINLSVNQTLPRTVITAGTVGTGGAVAVSVRRRCARAVRVRDAGGRHHEHVFHGVHRLGGGRAAEPASTLGSRVGVVRRCGRPGRAQAEAGQGVVALA